MLSLGKKAEAEKILESFKRLSAEEYLDPYLVAIAYYGLGNDNETIEWLEKAYQQKSALFIGLKEDMIWRGRIRSDPRYHDLLRRVGLTQ